MNRMLFALLLLAFAASYGQMQDRVAIINTLDDSDSISLSELSYLTDRLRETAVNVLPKQRYGVMTTESIVAFLGSLERLIKECNEASCLAELGRKVNADYVAQGRIRRFGEMFSINFELYSSKSGIMIGSFTGSAKDVPGLLGIIDEKAPVLFKKLEDDKKRLVSISTDPLGAALSFDGESVASCPKTPCKAALMEGSVRIIAALEQYETADTTVSITASSKAIAMRLNKIDNGLEEAKPAKASHAMVALALDIAGVVLVSAGIVANANMEKALDRYGESGRPQSHYRDSWSEVQGSRSARNIRYIAGGLALVSGIGVHIWF